MRQIQITYLFLFCLILVKNEVKAQSTLEKNTLIATDKSIGVENTGLYNGTEYVEFFRTANDRHKFYITREFTRGSLVYGRQFYGNVNLKYDLNADDILLDVGYKWKFPILKLFKDRITEFNLGGKTFINLGNEYSDITEGFHEVLWSSDSLTLLKKHQKKKFRRIQQTVAYYEFADDNSYYFKDNDIIYTLRNKRDLIKVFPSRKKEINKLYSKNAFKANAEINWILLFRSFQNSTLNDI